MSLVNKLNQVRAKLVSRIATRLGTDINNVIIGPRTNVDQFKKLPLIWVIAEDATINDEGLALHEQWDLYFWLIAVLRVSNQDHESAKTLAENLSVKASGSLLVDPISGKQNRTLDGLVDDITRVGWSAADSRIIDIDDLLYGAGVRVKIRLTNMEVD